MQRLIHSLQDGATVVTATRRLARTVVGHYDASQRALGKHCWPTAKALPWESFIENIWSQCLDMGIVTLPLATPDWEKCLWEQVIAEESDPLLNCTATANDAIIAQRLCVRYAISLDATSLYDLPETAAFRNWSQRVRERLSDSGLILHCDAERRLIGTVQSDKRWLQYLAPPALVMAGFEMLTPLHQSLLQAFRSQGVNVSDWQPKPILASSIVRHELPTSDAELRSAASCARRWLEHNPNAKIGVVVTDLQQSQRRVEQIFEDCLHPRQLLPRDPASDTTARAFNITLGEPLATQPMVSDALAGFALLAPRLSVSTVGQLLRSVFLDASSEYSACVLLDLKLRSDSEPMITRNDLIALANKQLPPKKPIAWIRCLNEIARLVPQSTHFTASASTWSRHFAAVLRILGWPGNKRSDSKVWQAAVATREVLVRFASLDRIIPPITVDTALQRIKTMLMDTVHQPRSEQQAPIQILGVLETAGLDFDQLWITAADNEHWPGNVRSNPFLPLALQRRVGVPNTSPASVYQHALATLSRLQAAADHVVFSHALTVDDHAVIASPLLSAIKATPPPDDIPTAIEAQCWYQADADEGALEPIDDPPPTPPPSNRVWRGVRLLQNQSQCPFKAFAIHRLDATSVSAREHGWDGRERGQAIHRLMDKIWKQLQNHSTLDQIPAAELQQRVAQCAHRVLGDLRKHYPQTLSSSFQRLEHTRLSTLALAWLAIEQQRPPFSVQKRESWSQMQWPGLIIRMRLDRIDALDSGNLVVIDYKTGKPDPGLQKIWYGDRPDDPQLPIYALALAQLGRPIAGVAFALLRPDSMCFKGISDEALSPNWKKTQTITVAIEQWQQTLAALAEDFITSKREVDPKNGADTCRYCELSPLCRIHELNAVTESSP